jgi:Uma2 family endonuclease
MTPPGSRAILAPMNTQARQPRRATYQDVLDAPAHMVAEIANGRLHLHPRPASRHARASFIMAGRLHDPFQGGPDNPGDWHFAIEPELHFGDDVLVPDLAGWRRQRMPVYPDTAFFTLAPDWVCEILSPSTRRFDVTEKRALYAANGVAHLWMLDPEARTLETFRLGPEGWLVGAAFKEGEEVRAAPFETLAFPLSALWPD